VTPDPHAVCLHMHVDWAPDQSSATCRDCGLTATLTEMEEAINEIWHR